MMSNTNSSNIEKKHKRGNVEDSNMSFGDHLMELRHRVIKSLLGLVLGFVISMFFSWDIIEFLAAPLVAALELNGFSSDLLTTGIATPFITYMKVAIISGVFLTSPWIFYQTWGFIAAGLYSHEKRYVNTFVPFAAILFVLGGLFFVTVVAPISMNFFLNFNKGFQIDPEPSAWHRLLMGKLEGDSLQEQAAESEPEAEKDSAGSRQTEPQQNDRVKMELVVPIPLMNDYFKLSADFPYHGSNNGSRVSDSDETVNEIVKVDTSGIEPIKAETPKRMSTIDVKCTINEYVHFVLLLALAFGISFQMPLAVFLLGRLNLVSLATLCKVRKYVVLGIVIFSAVITPPDVVSQILMSIPMYFLYELGILLVRFWPKKEIV